LDVSRQAQVIHPLMDLREKLSLSMVFITHDLRLILFISDRIAVMLSAEIRSDYQPAQAQKSCGKFSRTGEHDQIAPGYPFRLRCPFSSECFGEEVPRRKRRVWIIILSVFH
jgi:energy-coupling factor transporter ATP-binding protein EcfA2